MVRGTLVLLFSLLFLTPANASLDRKPKRDLHKYLSVPALPARTAAADDFRITEKTEVLLDSRPCRYDQVPDGATIILLETTTNLSKEITRIHFRSRRSSTSAAPK
jgi:hypothetical protein